MDYSGKIIKKTPVTPSQTSASGVWSLDDALQATKSNTWPVANVPDPISRSLRFRSSASAKLSRTPASAGNRKTWTWSGWFKRGSLSSRQTIFSVYGGLNNSDWIELRLDATTDILTFSGYSADILVTNQVFRDPSAWYHIVIAMDTTQATSSNRTKIYINGVQVTSFSVAAYPTLNQDTGMNMAAPHRIGDLAYNNLFNFDGYLAETYLIDGQALTPSSFGGTNAVTGVWEPRPYTGTYGTNGFLLTFSDNTSTTTLGNDTSGNGNNWTTNNISLTAGSTYDSMLDVPTQWIGYNTGDVASVTRGNYAVLNPISNPNSPIYTISAGNLNYSCSSSTGNAPKMAVLGSILMQGSGKYYCEATETSSNSTFGVTSGLVAGGTANGVNFATVYNGGTNSSAATYSGTTPTFTNGDVIGLAFDVSALTLAIYKNGTLLGTLSGLESTVNGWLFLQTVGTGALSTSAVWNFGQRPFSYTPPAGFLSLCTTNLPNPTILQGNQYFDVSLYTGNGSTQTITNSGAMKPDFVWYKSRVSSIYNHGLFDSVRGTTKQLFSNTTGAEGTFSGVTAFNSNGFSLGSDAGGNNNTDNYVAWQWKANGTGVTNTDGSITSTVSANTTAGFSIVTYTGNGSSGATIGHGLGVAPRMVIVQTRTGTNNKDKPVYHASIGNTGALTLNTTAATDTWAGYWNNTSPSSTVVTLGNDQNTNTNGSTYVAYCFAAVPGYSAFGSFVANGSADGPFVYLGFRPRYILWKNSSADGNWNVFDTAINTYNVVDKFLRPNTSEAETTGVPVLDMLSNGFKLRLSIGTSGNTYIYACFAENPFKNALAR